MRNLTIIVLLIGNFVFAQNDFNFIYIDSNSINWSNKNFIKNNVTKISTYSYKVSSKGKIKKDSVLIHQQEYNIKQNKIFGINPTINFLSHGPSSIEYQKFEKFYNDKGQLLTHIDKPVAIEKKKEFGSIKYETYKNIEEYEYDSLQNEVKNSSKHIIDSYSISKYTKDTLHLTFIERPRIDEYIYNTDNQKILRYHTVDSTQIIRSKGLSSKSTTTSCSYCEAKYLNSEWKYNSHKKLSEWIWYTSEKLIHSKKNYFYDSNQNLIKEVDSTGWYLKTVKPYLVSTTTYKYTAEGKIVTSIKSENQLFSESDSKGETYFDNQNRIIKSCMYDKSQKKCTEYLYFFNNNKLESTVKLFDTNNKLETKFYYNKSGLLIRVEQYRNGVLEGLIKHFYK